MPLYTVNVSEYVAGPIHTVQVVADDPTEARKAAVKKREDAGDREPLMTSMWREEG